MAPQIRQDLANSRLLVHGCAGRSVPRRKPKPGPLWTALPPEQAKAPPAGEPRVRATQVGIAALLAVLESGVAADSIRLIAVDIDGTLLNPQFQISEADLGALRRAHGLGIEVVPVTGRRHTFALPIAQQLGFDLWLISSNGAITRSLAGETFHRDLLPQATCRALVEKMQEFRNQTVVTFDREDRGAIVVENLSGLEGSIQRWLEKNLEYIEFVIPIENALDCDPIQAMFCGPIALMQRALEELSRCDLPITVLRTEYQWRDLSIVDVLNAGCSKGHALERWASHCGIVREQVMAVGDNYNDIEMLTFAGQPFIMGNASQELRNRGWKLTRSNAENGVAAAIEVVLDGTPVEPLVAKGPVLQTNT